jgi:tripartite-type tricarboxylate transporter receptor subunit TctC
MNHPHPDLPPEGEGEFFLPQWEKKVVASPSGGGLGWEWFCIATLAAYACVALFHIPATDAAQASAYPTRPIRLIVPVAAGGAADFAARLLAQKLSESWGPPVIVDNRPGGGGNVGVGLAAKAAPDGYTIVLPITSFPINPSVYSKLPFDTVKDFAPIVLVGSGALLLVVPPSLAAANVEQLIAVAKAKPGSLNYANSGAGTTAHLASELFKKMAGVDIVGVSYKGGGPAITDLMAGQVQMYFATIPAAIGQVKTGRLRALAVTSPRRVPELQQIPTVAESGLHGFDVIWWFGLFAPAGTPREVLAALNSESVKVLQQPATRERFTSHGMSAGGGTPQELATLLNIEIAKWGRVVREAKIHAE